MFIIFLVFLLVMSAVTYFTYAADKRKAKAKKWRIKEHTLLCMSFFGGALGGIFAMYGLRHKNRKWYFNAVNFGGLILHIVILIILL